MKNNIYGKKNFFLLLSCMWFIITFSVIQTTYAKYVTNVDAFANITIAYWNISVNTQDIIENSNLTSVMSTVFPGDSYSLPGVIVPNSTGYFDINVDSSKVSVPFTLNVNTKINESSALKSDFIISGYSLDNGTTITSFENGKTSFSLDIAKDTNATAIKIYVIWFDDVLDSIEDTALGISSGSAVLDVDLSFSQIV